MAEKKEPILVASATTTRRRLKREDCKRTKHDSAFSEWKLLIGPSDWEHHSTRKEGAERYRIHNLPNGSSCSGLYELGIAVPSTHSGRNTRIKFNGDNVIPVYLGQADNVRTRLQHYGRGGSHLENGSKSSDVLKDSSAGLAFGLFTDMFSRGYSIVYRWAPMKRKRDAEKTEAQLLHIFDYAWNKGSNGNRRPGDIIEKLVTSSLQSQNTPLFAVSEKLRALFQKKLGIKIEDCKRLQFDNESGEYPTERKNDIFSRILGIGRSPRSRLVSNRCDFGEDHGTGICGVALGQGSVCRELPVEGRKRCVEHKGMKVNGFSINITREKPLTADLNVESDSVIGPHFHDFELPICGVTLHDGTVCSREPVRGRKRCEEHKGRKVKRSNSMSSGLHCQAFPDSINKIEVICGIHLQDGTLCMRRPVVGRKRCEQHKGLRLALSKAKLAESDC